MVLPPRGAQVSPSTSGCNQTPLHKELQVTRGPQGHAAKLGQAPAGWLQCGIHTLPIPDNPGLARKPFLDTHHFVKQAKSQVLGKVKVISSKPWPLTVSPEALMVPRSPNTQHDCPGEGETGCAHHTLFWPWQSLLPPLPLSLTILEITIILDN